MKYAADGSQFVNEGGVPALYHGTDSTTAHSDLESVSVTDLVRCAQVMLGAVLRYLND
jgi:acetylornithine deacetylase/succinyl-diaminopimelate desuccinylase-like protein